ncbi:perosamine synthetase [Afipia sp. Root123D2]|uniref:DegT/DnrJ/EryC1/StrS family aminotransferase n=1 Tax=Afipia sp. Root123D2 TaxID=1736436 RepID=UPI0006F9AD92|nr:DegT/DnrJ/EryC1/StrS family aminotransferase [Afipia sp. Root123D2]KQW22295.1 perosamine synthetase [Afipia sp. Root123D2]
MNPKPKRTIQIAQPVTGEDEWLAMRESIESGWLTHGPKVNAFERAFSERHDVKHSLACTSATTGLHLALTAIGIGPGDEVIVPAFTWVATANAVLYCGATVVLCDVDPRTYNIDIQDAVRRVTSRTKAIIPVHLFGLCADIPALRALLPAHIRIIEDAACAAGGSLGNTSAGALGDVGVFSFHPRKSITTGEGGMITTNDAGIAERCIMLRNHGASISEEQRHRGAKPYILPDFNLLGFNYRMTDLQGSVGIVQLNKLDRFIDERATWAAWYRKKLSHIKWLRHPEEPKSGRHAWQSYVTYVEPDIAPLVRNEIMQFLQDRGVSTRPGTHAVHMLGFYRERFGYDADDFPGARDCDINTMAIPLHNRMCEDDYNYVVDALLEIS